MGTRQSHFISLWSGRQPLVLRMKLLVWCLVILGLAALAQQQDVVSNCAKQCSKACKCPCTAANTKPFIKYTKMKGKGKNKKPVADAQCQFDPSMGKKCGRCIKGVRTLNLKWAVREYRTTSTPSPPGELLASTT